MNGELTARFFEIVPIGLLSGLLSGAFGIGGGIVSVPLIRNLLHVSAQVAVGSSLAIIIPTGIIGSFNYLKQGKLIPKLACACAIPAALLTMLSSALSNFLSGPFLMLFLAALMALVGLDFAVGLSRNVRAGAENAAEHLEIDRRKLLLSGLIGAAVGVLSGFLGVGGGFVMVPAFCYFLQMPLKVAFGTSLLVVAIVALPGTLVHACYGHVQLWIVLPMIIGSLPGAWLGSYLSLKTRDGFLRIVFGIALLILAIYFAYRELSQAI